jgi:hypothetical protein
MPGFELGEKLPYRPQLSLALVVNALANAFFGIRARGNIQQPLISLGILHHHRSLAVNRKCYGSFALLEMLYEIAGRAPESSQRLNVGGDIEHERLRREHLKVP